MSRGKRLLALLPALLVIGCGSSQKPSSAATASVVTSASTQVPPEVSTSSASNTVTATAAPGSQTTHSTAPPQHVRIPATFTIHAGGTLIPPSVASPAFIAVQLTFSSTDGHAHSVVVKLPKPVALNVPARGHASALVPGLRAGQYAIAVDGSVRGYLVTGVEPGP